MQAVAEKVTFENGGAFVRELRGEADAYLAQPRVRRRGLVQLYAKAPIALGLTLASWCVLLFARPGAAGIALALVGLTAGTLLTAFVIFHDANHGAYFRSRRSNHLLGWSADVLLGYSSYAWRVKHNVAHHTYTNVEGFDADITQSPFARFLPSEARRSWYRWQHLYIWPMYLVMGLRWQIAGDAAAFGRGRIGQSALRFPRGWDLAGVVGGKLAFAAWAIGIPALFYPWWAVLAAYVGVSAVVSLVMAVTFQLAHCVEEASFTSVAELAGERPNWAVHEVETTVDFCQGSAAMCWILGGLNFQIEHHLFPRVPHTHYPALAPLVREACARHGVRYTAQPTLRAAFRSHYRHLRTMGELRLPVELEMG